MWYHFSLGQLGSVAVVGMAGRFPGANSVSAFWDNLRRGEESIATLSAETLSAAGIGDEVLANPAYVRRAPLLDGPDEFDADFFGFTPQAARMTDPQHRLFLQCAWHALEDAGCDPARFGGSIGVYGTSSASGYLATPALAPQCEHHYGPGHEHRPDRLDISERQRFLATLVSASSTCGARAWRRERRGGIHLACAVSAMERHVSVHPHHVGW